MPNISTTKTLLLSAASNMIAVASSLISTANGLGDEAGTGAPPPPTPQNNFPADPGAAPFPSPEDATSTVYKGKISGAPYLRSAQGAIWEFDTDASGNFIPFVSEYSSGYQVSVNGNAIKNAACQMLCVRQGQVYVQVDGFWSSLQGTDAAASGIAHTTLPPPWTTSGNTAGGHMVELPAMPDAPAPVSPAPGSTDKVITFGTDKADHPDIQSAHDAASPGDTLVYIGLGAATLATTLEVRKPLVIDGAGRVTNGGKADAVFVPGLILDVSTLDDPAGYPHQLGAIVPMTDCVIRGFRIIGAGMKEETHGGTAAVRVGAPCNLVVDHCLIDRNQNGIGPSGYKHTLKVTNTILLNNGLGPNDGGSHNVYAANGAQGGCVSATFGPGITSIVEPGIGGGHAIKSRANVTTLVKPFYIYAADSSSLDIPDGSTQICKIGAGTIAKKAGDTNHVLIGYGVESQLNGLAGVTVEGATIIAECDNPLIQTAGAMSFDASTVWKGSKPTAAGGGPVTGI